MDHGHISPMHVCDSRHERASFSGLAADEPKIPKHRGDQWAGYLAEDLFQRSHIIGEHLFNGPHFTSSGKLARAADDLPRPWIDDLHEHLRPEIRAMPLVGDETDL